MREVVVMRMRVGKVKKPVRLKQSTTGFELSPIRQCGGARAECLMNDLRQFAPGVLAGDDGQAAALDAGGLAFAAKLDPSSAAYKSPSRSGLEPFSSIEFLGIFSRELAHRAGPWPGGCRCRC